MKCYADTSFLVSLYSSDANSARADVWRQANPSPLPYTLLHRLEIRNALWQSVFRKKRAPHEASEVLQEMEVDVIAGLLAMPATSFDGVWKYADELSDAHTPATGARSLDILHVAAAKLLEVDEIVTFDQRQAGLALRIGLKVAVI